MPFLAATHGLGDLVIDEMPCAGCRYDLRGLNIGGVCPECGRTIIRSGARADADAPLMGSAPPAYLYMLMFGLVTLGVSGVALPLSITFTPDATGYGLAARLIVAAVWMIGVIAVTRPHPVAQRTATEQHTDPQSRLLRRAVVGTQLAWLLVPGVQYVSWQLASDAVNAGAQVLIVVGAAGWPLLAWRLALLADWGGEGGVRNRLRGSAWMLAIVGGALLTGRVLGLSDHPILQFLWFLAPAILLLWGVAYLVLLLSAFQLIGVIQWARANQRKADARDRRRADRDRESVQEDEARASALLCADPIDERMLADLDHTQDNPRHGPSDKERHIHQNLPMIEKPGEDNPYPLEDD